MFWIPAATVSMHLLNVNGAKVRMRDLLPTRTSANPVSVDDKLRGFFVQQMAGGRRTT
jgi:hypothetical protein